MRADLLLRYLVARLTNLRREIRHIGFNDEPMEADMLKQIRHWRRTRRYRTTVAQLTALSAAELSQLGIRHAEISRLAWAASFN